eukprot:COSAG02_NODE_669_length_18681_cov_170.310499_7_plen_135_part_00
MGTRPEPYSKSYIVYGAPRAARARTHGEAADFTTDLNLCCGIWDIPQGADYLEKNVPMDKGTVEEDAWMYLATPGLGLSYGIGKTQIMRFLALARQHHDDSGDERPFDLRGFHDSLWLNGNVPIELHAYELLGG